MIKNKLMKAWAIFVKNTFAWLCPMLKQWAIDTIKKEEAIIKQKLANINFDKPKKKRRK